VRVVSKVVQFVPYVGKAASKALGTASDVANDASNAIHVKMGGKLGKAMRDINKTRKIAGYIPRELLGDALEERGLEDRDARYGYDGDISAREVYDEVLYARDWNA
jgi:hypothetical protein